MCPQSFPLSIRFDMSLADESAAVAAVVFPGFVVDDTGDEQSSNASWFGFRPGRLIS